MLKDQDQRTHFVFLFAQQSVASGTNVQLKSPRVAPKKSLKSTGVKRRQGVQGWDFEQGKHFRSFDLKNMQTSWTEQCGT